MLNSFEYVDPILAQKIHTLEMELKKVRQTQEEIMSNAKLMPNTRDKLLRYQKECSQNIERMLAEQKDKLVEYLDEQTNVITKTNRLSSTKPIKSHNVILNQSTRIDFSTVDDSKSLDLTKTDINRTVSNFYMPATTARQSSNGKYGNKNLVKIRRLKKQVWNQSKLIKMLVTWVKIYYERQQTYKIGVEADLQAENTALKQQNSQLQLKCSRLSQDLLHLRTNFKNKTLDILETHKRYEQIKNENSGLKLQRKELLNNARSLRKTVHNT